VSKRRTSPISAAKVHGDQEGGTAHCLVGRDDRSHRPGRHDRGQLLVQAVQPLSRIRDRVDLLLEDDLLCRVLEGPTGKPTPVCHRPMTAAVVDPAMAQEKGEQLLTFAAQVIRASVPSPDQIANRFVNHVRNPDAGQFAGAMQPCQRDRIPPVGLDPLARPLRDQSRRNHHAVVAKIPDLPIQPVPREV
jgi:hypothetical protein